MVKLSPTFPPEKIHTNNFSLNLKQLSSHFTEPFHCWAHEFPAMHPAVGEVEQRVRCDPHMEEQRWVLNWNYSALTQLKNST